MSGGTIETRIEDGVKWIVFSNPGKMNALSPQMRDDFVDAMRSAQSDHNVRAIIVAGQGGNFCSGADVSSLSGGALKSSRRGSLELTGQLMLCFAEVDKPVVAAISGVAAGVGLSIALACDMRICSPDARFGAIWVKRGLVGDGGATVLLPLLLRNDVALQLVLTGRMVQSKEALEIGLVTEVAAGPEELHEKCTAITQEICALPPIAVELNKRIMLKKIRAEILEGLYLETYAQEKCKSTADHKEAVAAFMEKRKPQFLGY